MKLPKSHPTPGITPGLITIRAARLIDVRRGLLIKKPAITTLGDRIVSVDKNDIPLASHIVDLGDRTLLPGLIDVHTHLTHNLSGPDWPHRDVVKAAADDAFTAARNARLALHSGFTTVRDVGCRSFVDVSLMEAVDAGLVEGPRVIPCGYLLSITGGHFDSNGFAPGVLERGPKEGVANGEGVIEAVRYEIKHGVKWIKVAATGGVLSLDAVAGAQAYSEWELRLIVEEASRHGLMVAAHAHGTEGIDACIAARVTSIEHGSLLTSKTIARMKESGTYLVPTTYVADYILSHLEKYPPSIQAKAKEMLPKMKDSHRKAIRAGVAIAFGSDCGVYPCGRESLREFAALVERGMSNLLAIRAATIRAAELLRTSDRGVLERGRLADLIAVRGNPLDDINAMENVDFVMKGGSIVSSPLGLE